MKRPPRTLFLASTILFLATLAFTQAAPTLTPQNSGTTATLIGLSPVNSHVVWASGTGGTFVVTTDGGNHWHAGVVPGAETLQFRDVQGISDKVAYLLSIGSGTDSRIYKTTDGGATWRCGTDIRMSPTPWICGDGGGTDGGGGEAFPNRDGLGEWA